MNASAPDRPGRDAHINKPMVTGEPAHPRRKTLVSHCKTCKRPFAFEADQVNTGGMYQLDEGANRCPNCGTEADEVYELAPDAVQWERQT